MQRTGRLFAFMAGLACLLGTTATVASTVVPPGTISLDTTWDLAGSPYLVSGSVVVNGTDGGDGVTTLTIEPGVEVRFALNAWLQIGGSSASSPGALVADGDAAGGPATIVMTADSVSPTPQYWYGIHLRSGTVDTTILRNIEIRYAGRNSYAGIYAAQAAGRTIIVDQATILDSGIGVRILSGDLQVSNSTLRDNSTADVSINGSTNADGSFDNCTIESVFYSGTAAQPIGWTNNTFLEYGAVTSRIDPDDLGDFSTNNSFTPEPSAVTEIVAGIAGRDATWAAITPYVAMGTLTVRGAGGVLATVTLAPGVEMRMPLNSNFTVGGTSASTPGALIADGDAAGGPATIRFISSLSTPAPGDWQGVLLSPATDASTLFRNVEILHAGRSGYAGIYANPFAGTTIVIDDVTVRDSLSQGVRFLRGDAQITDCTLQNNATGDIGFANSTGVSGSVSGCTLGSVVYDGVNPDPIVWGSNSFVDYGAVTSKLDPDDIGELSSNGSFASVPDAVTQVLGGTVAGDGTWTAAPSPYVALATVTVEGAASVLATLTLEPGVEIRFRLNTGITVGGTASTRPGALIADGDATGGPATILFTADSGAPTPGFWNGINTRIGTEGSTLLRNVEIRYAGRSGYAGLYANHLAATSITVDDATIRDSSTQGINLLAGGLDVTDSTILNNATGDIRFQNSSSVSGSVSGCTLGSVRYAGTQPQPIVWSNNTFLSYGTVTSIIDPDDLGEFANNGTFTSAPDAVTQVLGGDVARDSTWPLAASPYVVQGVVTVQGASSTLVTLTLEPGVELRFETNTRLSVGGTIASRPGALIADGNAAGGPATIVFTSDSATPAAGDWSGIDTRTGMDGSTLLRNVLIRYAGRAGYANLYLNHAAAASITIDDATILDSSTYGLNVIGGGFGLSDSTVQDNNLGDLRFQSSANVSGSVSGCTLGAVIYGGTQPQPLSYSNNSFVNYGAVTSRIDPDDLGEFSTGGTFSSVPDAVTEVHGGEVARDSTWTAGPSPYVGLGAITIQGTASTLATVTLDPGVEMRFNANAGISVGGTTATRPGALIADGDAAGGPATIRFTANSDTPTRGFWRGVDTRFAMDGSTLLRNVEIGYPGGSGYSGLYANHQAGNTITLDNVTIHDSARAGIRLLSGDAAVSGSTLQDNDGPDVRLQSSANVAATFTGNTLESVVYDGVFTGPTTWTGNTFDNWGLRTSKLRIEDLDQFTHANTFNPVTGAVLDVFAGTVDLDGAWGPAAGPLVFDNNLFVNGTDGGDGRTTLTLDPGVTVRLPASRGLYVGLVAGDPGELIADGLAGGMTAETINFSVDSDVPNSGDWFGLRVDNTGRAVLRDVQVRYATSGVRVDGTLGVSSNVTVNRSNIGLELDGATLEGVLRGWSFRNCGTGVRATGTDAEFREANLLGSTFGVENLTPVSNCIDAEMNYWGADSGPSGSAPLVGCETATPGGSGAMITEGVSFTSFLDTTPDDGDAVACDDGDGFPDPCGGGNTIDCDDNCCQVANDSQADLDSDGVGDACDSNPVLRVSSDPVDAADFSIVQDAVDASIQSGSRVEILPGLGPYSESVRVDRSQVYLFEGVTNLNMDPIVIDGGSGPAFRVINKVGTAPMRFRFLTLSGGQGIRSEVDTATNDMIFDNISGEALQLDGGDHTADRLVVGPSVGAAARIEQGASLAGRRVDVLGATDTGFDADGALTLENVLVAGGADGVRLRTNGSLEARFVTIADNTGIGVDASVGGTVSSIEKSILYDNALGDLDSVPCSALSWTLTGTPDCSGVGDNQVGDPLLDFDYRLLDGSPCLDYGPDPVTYSGSPSTDLDGGVRLADYDGNGLATNDCGTFEMLSPNPFPGEVGGLRWDFDFRLLWDAEPDAVEYHVYRDLLSNLSFASFGLCRDDLDGDRTDLQLDDVDEPIPGEAFFYGITAEAVGGEEGTLGFGTSAERSNFNVCP